MSNRSNNHPLGHRVAMGERINIIVANEPSDCHTTLNFNRIRLRPIVRPSEQVFLGKWQLEWVAVGHFPFQGQ